MLLYLKIQVNLTWVLSFWKCPNIHNIILIHLSNYIYRKQLSQENEIHENKYPFLKQFMCCYLKKKLIIQQWFNFNWLNTNMSRSSHETKLQMIIIACGLMFKINAKYFAKYFIKRISVWIDFVHYIKIKQSITSSTLKWSFGHKPISHKHKTYIHI